MKSDKIRRKQGNKNPLDPFDEPIKINDNANLFDSKLSGYNYDDEKIDERRDPIQPQVVLDGETFDKMAENPDSIENLQSILNIPVNPEVKNSLRNSVDSLHKLDPMTAEQEYYNNKVKENVVNLHSKSKTSLNLPMGKYSTPGNNSFLRSDSKVGLLEEGEHPGLDGLLDPHNIMNPSRPFMDSLDQMDHSPSPDPSPVHIDPISGLMGPNRRTRMKDRLRMMRADRKVKDVMQGVRPGQDDTPYLDYLEQLQN